MRIESEYDRDERRARAGIAAGVGLAVVAVLLALLVRYRPDLATALIPISYSDTASSSRAREDTAHAEESATLARSAAAATPDQAVPSESAAAPAQQPQADSTADSSRANSDTTAMEKFELPRNVAAALPFSRYVVTDVILLPCSTPNPRPDGSVLIPPHDPTHRTIVGLPQKPGEPARGFVIPQHDPRRENQVPIRIIAMDSILARALRVPPHDPHNFNVARPDTLACIAGR